MKTSIVSLLCICCAFNAVAALRIGNSGTGRGGSYSAVQSQGSVNSPMSQQELIASARTSEELGLPVRVADMDLARSIARGDSNAGVTKGQLEMCAAIYPTGAWAWDVPSFAVGAKPTCIADVEMRVVNGTDDIVVARVKVAAGSSIRCNISDFPTDGYTTEAGTVVFPADKEPTMEDIVAIMNKEQKQNAGMKIAAAAIIGGLGGNFIGQNDPGKGGALGTSSDKMTKGAIGAVALGGLTAISTQTGKVAGDTIMGATVNAAGGGLIGNISGIGNPVLLIRKCEGTDCLYGYVAKNESLSSEETGFIGSKGSYVKCKNPNSNLDYSDCKYTNFQNWTLSDSINQDSELKDLKEFMDSNQNKFCLENKKMQDTTNYSCTGDEYFYQLKSADEYGKKESAVIVGWDKKLNKSSDFKNWRRSGKNGQFVIKYRKKDGSIGDPVSNDLGIDNFQPLTQDATDGSIIDLDNKARQGATITGAGVGAGLGGFSAYQGAKTEIDNRWATEVQAYKDSLTKFYCATGKRFLSQYNEVLVIPAITTME
ncbi:MAG: hypothetical protein ACOX7D_02820 [Alphaproteobacteria bacterium]